MRGIRRIPLMPPIPLRIRVAEDFHPQNEGDSRKTLFFSSKVPHFCRQSATFLPTKCHTFCGKVPHSLQQSTTLPLTKYRFAALESRPRQVRKPSSSGAKAVLAGHESRPRRVRKPSSSVKHGIVFTLFLQQLLDFLHILLTLLRNDACPGELLQVVQE